VSAAIRLEKVSVRYRIPRERIGSLKEYAIRRLKRRLFFDEFEALREVDFEVGPGEGVGVIGRNGAGKSTLLRLVARVMLPSAGRVVVVGRTAPLLELGLGFHGELTGRENIMLHGTLLGFSRAEMRSRTPRIVEWAELEEFIDAPVRTYSTGMAARLAFSVATDVDPDILLDETLDGLVEMFKEWYKNALNKGVNVFTDLTRDNPQTFQGLYSEVGNHLLQRKDAPMRHRKHAHA